MKNLFLYFFNIFLNIDIFYFYNKINRKRLDLNHYMHKIKKRKRIREKKILARFYRHRQAMDLQYKRDNRTYKYEPKVYNKTNQNYFLQLVNNEFYFVTNYDVGVWRWLYYKTNHVLPENINGLVSWSTDSCVNIIKELTLKNRRTKKYETIKIFLPTLPVNIKVGNIKIDNLTFIKRMVKLKKSYIQDYISLDWPHVGNEMWKINITKEQFATKWRTLNYFELFYDKMVNNENCAYKDEVFGVQNFDFLFTENQFDDSKLMDVYRVKWKHMAKFTYKVFCDELIVRSYKKRASNEILYEIDKAYRFFYKKNDYDYDDEI